ncbi:iron permease 1, partial [Phaeodactylum tricornutum CCAP 1055/1]|eukprot:XP_002182619.1 iron permease 1 [Phaeodactylum tricornutum CCAP 1055/1]
MAFGLVIGAGAATGLGAAVVFFPALVRLASRRTLAGALGLSAGVMVYVSFVEIFGKASSAFEDSGIEEDTAYIYATLCFFGGVVLMVVRTFVAEESDSPGSPDEEDTPETKDSKKLMRMSLNTALAIGIHNFPEGLATFVATLGDPKVGGVLAVAIAIHNIPEGLCVAMPVYYATGNRWKAFGWAMLSGMSEPFAALLGWAILANSFSDKLYGILFGIVSGMMVVISTRELLPTAHRYDPEDSVVTYSFIAGMCIMALSLVLFLL